MKMGTNQSNIRAHFPSIKGKSAMQRKILQIILTVLGLIPIVTGMLGMLGVDDPLYASIGLPRSALLDSNMRFYSGVWFVLGIAVLSTIRNLEKHFPLYCILWGMIFAGGIGRLLSIFLVGFPPIPFIGLTLLELIGAPGLLYWHSRIASR
jgi:hypothetical protein